MADLSKEDSTQVLVKAYDEPSNSIRVTTTGTSEIVISDAEDSIKVGDGDGHYLDVNPDGSLLLPSGASSAAKQDEGNSSLASIDLKVATADRQDVGNSSLASIDTKVATAANQTTTHTKLDVLDASVNVGNDILDSIDSKVATAAKQDVGNASLASIDTNVATHALQTAGNAILSSIDTKVATAAKQDTGNASLASIDSKVATEAKQDATITELQAIEAVVATADRQDTGNTSLASIDSKVATTAKQDVGNTSLASIDAKVSTAANQVITHSKLDSLEAAVETNQPRRMQDGAGTGLTSTLVGVKQSLDVNVSQSALPAGGSTAAKQDEQTALLTSIDSNVATHALQTTGNAILSSIDAKVATSAKQDATLTEAQGLRSDLNNQLDAANATLSSVDTKVSTAAKQDAALTEAQTLRTDLNAQLTDANTALDGANVTLSSIDVKVATAAKQDTALTEAQGLRSDLNSQLTDANDTLTSIDGKVATAAKQDAALTELQSFHSDNNTLTGATNETAPATDTAASGLNGRLQRVAQHLTTVEGKQDDALTEAQGLRSDLNSQLTDANNALDAANVTLTSVDGKVATAAKQDTALTEAQALRTALNTQLTDANSALDSIDAKVATGAKQDAALTEAQGLRSDLNAQLTDANAALDSIDAKVATAGKQDTALSEAQSFHSDSNERLGAIDETAPLTDTADSGLNGRLQRVAQHLTTVEGKQDTALTEAQGFRTDVNTQLTDANSALDSIDGKVSTAAKQDDALTEAQSFHSDNNARLGATNEAAPASDTGTSGINGRLQRLAQHGTTTHGKLDTVNTNLVTVQGKQDTALTEAQTLRTENSARLGATNETAASSDTATSGLNGLFKRLLQRVTTFITTQTDGTQRTKVTDGTFNTSVSPYNRLRVSTEPSTVFVDKFDGSSLDTNMWTQQNGGGGTISIGTGNLQLNTGTSTGARAMISTVPTFQHPGNAFLQYGMAVKLETALVTNTIRYWGFATGGAFTYANPLTDGVIFEVRPDGTLRAAVYNSGSVVFSQAITAPTDGNFHRYDIFYNTQNVSWYIDGTLQVQSTVGYNPVTQTLPARFAMLNNTVSAPSGTPTLQSQAFAITDTARNNVQISDGLYPWRKSRVDANGSMRATLFDTSGTEFGTKTNPLQVRTPGFSSGSATRVPVATSSVQLLAANTNRRYVHIINNSTTTAFLQLGAAAVVGQGISLPAGSTFRIDFTNLWLGSIFAITTIATINLDIFEGTS